MTRCSLTQKIICPFSIEIKNHNTLKMARLVVVLNFGMAKSIFLRRLKIKAAHRPNAPVTKPELFTYDYSRQVVKPLRWGKYRDVSL